MKKLLMFVVFAIFLTSVNTLSVSAEKQHKHDSEGMKQVMDNYIISQYNDELVQAVKDFYKEEVGIQYNWWNKNYDVVEIDQAEKGNELSHQFIIKFNVLTYSKNSKKILGKDTITFGVTPIIFSKEMNQKNIAASKVEFLDFTHREPTKNN